jgi:predicted Zn-dependent protease
MGRAQLAVGQDNQARVSFQRAHELSAEWIEPVTALALLDVRAKKFDEALQRANEVLAKHPGDPDALVLKGDVLASAGKMRDAAAAFADAQPTCAAKGSRRVRGGRAADARRCRGTQQPGLDLFPDE